MSNEPDTLHRLADEVHEARQALAAGDHKTADRTLADVGARLRALADAESGDDTRREAAEGHFGPVVEPGEGETGA